jgi:transcriptional regulator with PAS, ATPase and Fis domain
MILVKRIPLYTAFLVIGLIIILLGVINYLKLTSIETFDIRLVKYYAENMIFMSIVSVIILISAVFIIHRGGVRVLREIDKATEISRSGRYYSIEYTKKLGKLGDKINRLFLELNTLNDMKSLKISSISNINAFLMDNTDLHVLILDIEGTIQSCSKRLLEKLNVKAQDIKGKSFTEVITDPDFQQIVKELERNRSSVSTEKSILSLGEGRFQIYAVFYPIFNIRNELSNIVCIIEKEALLSSISRKAEQISKAPKKIAGILKKSRTRRERQNNS